MQRCYAASNTTQRYCRDTKQIMQKYICRDTTGRCLRLVHSVHYPCGVHQNNCNSQKMNNANSQQQRQFTRNKQRVSAQNPIHTNHANSHETRQFTNTIMLIHKNNKTSAQLTTTNTRCFFGHNMI